MTYQNRIKETATVSGTGDITLTGVISGYRTFVSKYSNGASIFYAIHNTTDDTWEMGIGTYNSGPNTITRNSVESSTSADALVNFTMGTKVVYNDVPASEFNLISPARGGTGVNNSTFTLTLSGNNQLPNITVGNMIVDITTSNIYGYTPKHNKQTGTTYTLLQSDSGKIVEITNSSPITLTLPATFTDFCCRVVQGGTGQITFAAAGSGTIHQRSSFTKTAGQWAEMDLYVRSNSGGSAAEYVLGGDGA